MAIFILRKPKLCTAFNQLLITLCIIDTCVLLSNIPTTVNSLGTRKFYKLIIYLLTYKTFLRRFGSHRTLRQSKQSRLHLCLHFPYCVAFNGTPICHLFTSRLPNTNENCTQMETFGKIHHTCNTDFLAFEYPFISQLEKGYST